MNIYESWLCTKPIANKGLHDDNIPENSLSAFKNAIDNDFAIKIDVRELADGTVVVFHDEALGRMTGADGFISNYTYDDIKELCLLKTKEHIPTLEEVLEFVDGKTPILVEVINAGKVGFEKNVWKALSKYKGEFAIQSLNPYSLEWFKINAPHIRRGQVSSFFKGNETLSFSKKFALKRMMLNKKVSEPNFIAYQAENLPNRFVKKYKSLPILAWCVRSPEMRDRVQKHCNNIIFEGFNLEDEAVEE